MMMNRKRTGWILIGLVVAAVIATGAVLLPVGAKKGDLEGKTERVVKLYRIPDVAVTPNRIAYPGEIKPVKHASLFFRVSGPVIEQKLELGQAVKAGEVLMRIDPRDYEREVEKLAHELEMQKIQTSLLETEYERTKKLISSQATSQSLYDAALSKKQASEVQVKILETALKIANDRLKDTVLYAPFDGAISEVRIERYEMAQANVPVVVLQSLRTLDIIVNVSEGNIPDMSLYEGNTFKGRKFNVTFPGRGNRVFAATFEEFRPSAAAESGTYELRLRMEQPSDFIILPGMTAEVHGLPHMKRKMDQTLKVPFAAVFEHDGKAFVWKYNPEKSDVTRIAVVIGKPVDSNFLTISGDVQPGDLIVAAGCDWLNEGMRVHPMNPEVGE